MLEKIKIRNLAIIDELEIDFCPSFNALTGESGAGKTIVYKAINYLFGEPFKKENIRRGESLCEISGAININSSLFTLKRIFTKSTTKNFINGEAVNRNKYLDFIGEEWESYGQHEQQLLLDSNNHIIYIDLFSKNKNILNKYQLLFNQFTLISAEIKTIISSNDDYSKNKEFYDYQLNELDNLSVDDEEEDKLKEKIKEIEKSKEVSNHLNILTNITSTSDILSLLDKTSNVLESISKKSSSLENMIERMNNLNHEISDLEYEASNLSKDYYYNQTELEDHQKKILEINDLKRKYGGTIESIYSYKKELEDKIKNSENIDVLLEEKMKKKTKIKDDLLEQANFLFKRRKEASKKLELNIKNDLDSMEMKDVEFSVELGNVAINDKGIDECVFNIRTNKGESVKSIGNMASGGELSRIMMAIKLSINITSKNKIFILDEIDAGLSGKEAASIGDIIKRLARRNQVICITHLSQIASKAREHFRISKRLLNERTVCNIDILNKDQKIRELATMISGKDITSQSIDYAKNILGQN